VFFERAVLSVGGRHFFFPEPLPLFLVASFPAPKLLDLHVCCSGVSFLLLRLMRLGKANWFAKGLMFEIFLLNQGDRSRSFWCGSCVCGK